MKTLRFSMVALLLLAAAAAPLAQEEPEARVFNFLILFNGARIGWVKTTVQPAELDGKAVLHEREDCWLQIRRSFDDSVFETVSVTETWRDADGAVLRKVDQTTSGNQTERTEVAYKRDQSVITYSVDGGKPSVTTLEHGKHTVYCDMRAWRLLKDAQRLKAGERLDFHSVDDADKALVEQVWIVNGRTKRRLADNSVIEGTEISVVKGGRAGTVVFGDDDLPLYFADAAGFTLERVEEIPQPFVAQRISLRSTMKANVAIKGQHELERMTVHFKFEHDDGNGVPLLVTGNDYQDVLKYDEGYAIRLKSRKVPDDFDAPALPLAEVPDDVAKYLKPTPLSQSDDPVLIKQAESLTRGKKDSLEITRAIMRFVAQRLIRGSGDTGTASARQAFDEQRGDCTEHAALLVALARAVGLPARSVSGFSYLCAPGATSAIFGFHAWAEVWLGRWVPVDSTVLELGTSARYVYFCVNEPGEVDGRSSTSRCLRQGITPIIDSYELGNGFKWTRRGARAFKFE
jgi:hypothetical protein